MEISFDGVLADFEAGLFEQAEIGCRALIGTQSSDPDVYHLLGAVLCKLDRLEEAVTAFRQATKLAPGDGEIFANLGAALEAQGDFVAAEDAYCHALELGETDSEILYGAALAAKMSGKIDTAVKLLEAPAQLHKNDLRVWNLLAVCRMESGNIKGAARAFKHLLKIEPNDLNIVGNYAVVLAKLGRREEAKILFAKAVSQPNADASCLLNFGMLLQEGGEETQALKMYQRAAERDPESPLICEAFAKLARRHHQDVRVIEHLNETVSEHPALDFAWFYLAVALLAKGDLGPGGDAMARYLELDPSDRLGGRLKLGASGVEDIPNRATSAYLKNFYRIRAHTWDQTVKENYNGHELILAAVKESVREIGHNGHVLDVGCGSGSLGIRLKSLVKRLDGVDISPEMAAVAESKGVYEAIEVADLVDFLSRKHEAYDLIVSAAVLFHFRALDKVLTVMANALRRSGQLIFTVFKSTDGTSRLNEHNFFEHPWLEIKAAITAAGLTPVSVTEAIHEYSSDNEPRECFCVRCHFE